MYADRDKPEAIINAPIQVGKSKDDHKIINVLKIGFFILSYRPPLE